MNGGGASFCAQWAGMRKFPELSSYNVFISEPHRDLHMKGSWLRDQKSVSCWAGSMSWSCRIFTASVCWPVSSPPPLLFKFICSGSWQSHSGEFFKKNSQDPVYLLTSNYGCAELLKNEMSSNKQSGCPLTCMLYGYFASSQLFVNQRLFTLLSEEFFDDITWMTHFWCVRLCYQPCFLPMLQNDPL